MVFMLNDLTDVVKCLVAVVCFGLSMQLDVLGE